MYRILAFCFVFFLVLTSCASFKNPEFRKSEGVKFIKMDNRELSFEVDAILYNPNKFSLKVKPSHVDVFVEDQKMGVVYLTNKIKLHRLQEEKLHFEMKAALEDGAMLTAFRYMNRDSVSIHLMGKVKGGIWFVSKKVKIDETIKIPGKSLKFGMGGN
jgi:LEA14-like dessication related protein